ncbi:MarR family winged helix-turn-helix transcriptional regulator [Pseudomonas tohonis]|uniref:MarR family winged helix-turn-helix transcriptional regulator n=1 Tax=Pseudomonas tohonis TaxID=2725477 RepID=UPI0022F09B70|nr:MarR family winged helix-turn-helix transcriptional regulator [Pseudomonas tohonis]
MITTRCLCTRLRRASRNLTRIYDDALESVGINVAQYSLLNNLQRLDQPSITELAEALGLDRSTLGRNLRVLEGRGLVRMDEGEDQRNRLVALTTDGTACVAAALQAWEGVQVRMTERLGDERRDALMALLGELETLD